MVMLVMMVVMAAAGVKMVGPASESSEEQPKAHTGDHEPAGEAQKRLQFCRDRSGKEKYEQCGQHNHRPRMGNCGHDAEKERMPGRSPLTD